MPRVFRAAGLQQGACSQYALGRRIGILAEGGYVKKLSELRNGLAELEDAISRFPVRPEYVFADLAALGFARDVLENGHAVALLAESPVPRSLYPCARAAFEALFELVYLLKSKDFNLMGCRAHVAERRRIAPHAARWSAGSGRGARYET